MEYYVVAGKWIDVKTSETPTYRLQISKSEDDDVYKIVSWRLIPNEKPLLLGAAFMSAAKLQRVHPGVLD